MSYKIQIAKNGKTIEFQGFYLILLMLKCPKIKQIHSVVVVFLSSSFFFFLIPL